MHFIFERLFTSSYFLNINGNRIWIIIEIIVKTLLMKESEKFFFIQWPNMIRANCICLLYSEMCKTVLSHNGEDLRISYFFIISNHISKVINKIYYLSVEPWNNISSTSYFLKVLFEESRYCLPRVLLVYFPFPRSCISYLGHKITITLCYTLI